MAHMCLSPDKHALVYLHSLPNASQLDSIGQEVLGTYIPVEVAPVDHVMLADVELLALVIVRESFVGPAVGETHESRDREMRSLEE